MDSERFQLEGGNSEANESAPTPEWPETIGHFRFVRHLSSTGNSAFSAVYSRDDSSYCLKLARPDLSQENRIRFLAEGEALKKLTGNFHIPRWIEYGEHEGRPYIVMELAKGESLRKRLQSAHEHGTLAGVPFTSKVVSGLVKALKCAQEHDIVHRDVKDDNVICDDTADNVTLIDWGQVKDLNVDSGTQTHSPGFAIVYAPPSKIRAPQNANISDDIFAVGVLAYQLLAGCLPWSFSAGSESDIEYADKISGHGPPRSVWELNNRVPSAFSRLIMKMLELEPHKRANIEEILAELDRLKKDPPRVVAPLSNTSTSAKIKIFHDPIHGDIALSQYERDIISSKEMQRLKYLFQLGFTYQVYPGATHNRFSHSIGTLAVAQRIIDTVSRNANRQIYDPDEQVAIRLYALVHDVAHICFGHTLEDELLIYPRHDQNIDRISRLTSSRFELGKLLDQTDPGRLVKDALENGESTVNKLTEITSSPWGADVMDYIDRDSYYCGLHHKVDPALYRTFTAKNDTAESSTIVADLYSSFGYRVDVDIALTDLLRDRYSLYSKAYTKRSKLICGAMLGKALRIVKDNQGSPFSEEALEWYGDDELLVRLADESDINVRELALRMRNRLLYKVCYRAQIVSDHDITLINAAVNRLTETNVNSVEGLNSVERSLADAGNCESWQVIVYAPVKAPGIRKVQKQLDFVKSGPRAAEVERKALEVTRDHARLWEIMVLAHPDLNSSQQMSIREKAQEIFKYDNIAPVPVAQQLKLF